MPGLPLSNSCLILVIITGALSLLTLSVMALESIIPGPFQITYELGYYFIVSLLGDVSSETCASYGNKIYVPFLLLTWSHWPEFQLLIRMPSLLF
jgi:hypothetical protein